jgi:predicted nuclease of predicted toxin-antitoxin system
MRFLANENFPLDAVEALRQNGHDVLWIRVESPGISDREVLSRAQAENRILLTFDQDFGELAFRSRLLASVGIILFRIRVPSGSVVAEKVAKVISLRDDWYGHFTVIEEDKIGSSLLFMLNQHTRCQDNILLTQKFQKFLKP